MDKFFLCVQMGTYLFFLQLVLFCEEILLEKYFKQIFWTPM